MDAIISLREVTKRFRETVALDKVTVDFEAGKIHGIVGRNGSGKTVLMKCVCGLMHQDAGEILVRGQRWRRTSPRDRGHY
ncbi:MAG: ATP-binding cassette domain-containing protein [Acutalibacter sp.]